MADRRAKSPSDYLQLLDRDPTELDALISSLLIKVTSFFRDPDTWQVLSKQVVTQLLAERRAGQELRVWCAGCATGEEAYSVAMLLADALGDGFAKENIKIFGTDLDEQAVAYGRRGRYAARQLEGLRPDLRDRWFVPDGPAYSVSKELRQRLVFGVNNLVSDAPISRLDLLICRNVFIYLEASLQKVVLTRFHYALRPSGILVLGKSELIPFAGKIFQPVDLPRRIYRKDGVRDGALAQERLAGGREQRSQQRQLEEQARRSVEPLYRDLFTSLRLPIIATALDGSITAWNRAAAVFWGRAESAVIGKKLTALDLAGFSGDLLIEKTAAVREGKVDRERGTTTAQPHGQSRVRSLAVNVWPLRDHLDAVAGIVYVVEDVTQTRHLEDELRRLNEERQSAFEELQTTNEELQSSNGELETLNEELQSANEELQTTNEELQTTNEELQSTNAELDATNRELAHRTEELNRVNFSQRTILRSLSAGVVVIDEDGRITSWNLTAERLLGIAESEAVGQTLWTLHLPALSRSILQRARKTLGEGRALRAEEIDYQLPTGSTGRATLAAVPIIDGKVSAGAVLIVEDATRQALLQKQLAELRGDKPAKAKRPRRS